MLNISPKPKNDLNILFGILLFIFFIEPTFSFAQLNATFTVNKESGCKPLTVQFTNTSTGAGSDVVYAWDFGNGNTSALPNPGATYIEEKIYVITLTVKSGGNTSTASKQIIVYKTPTVDFSATPTKGCMPLTVGFTASATPGDGSISRYFWDYGDGRTEEGPMLVTPSHTYSFAQQAPVGLTVTNSFGCFNTKTYGGLINVYPEVIADFSADRVTLCKAGETIQFNEKSSGGSLTKYEWNFGDGTSSTDKNPAHVYNQEGVFDVKLKSTNSSGCTSEKIIEKYIRVAAFGQKINYYKEKIFCAEDETTFYSAYNGDDFNYNVLWYLNGQLVRGYQEHRYDLFHKEPGIYTIKAEFNFNGCKVEETKSIEVFPKPPLKGMVINRGASCNIPFEITFSDTTTGVTKWDWTFWHVTVPQEKRVLKSFSHTFPFEQDIGGTVFLTVENEYGCKAQDNKNFSLVTPKVLVETIETHYNDFFRCKERIYTFRGTLWSGGRDKFIVDSLSWDFGDTTITGTAQPTYQFKDGLDKNILFRYKTEGGCSGTIPYLLTQFKVTNTLDFSILPGNQICGNNLFQLIPKGSPTNAIYFYDENWKYLQFTRDANGNTIPYYKFRDSGNFKIHMINKGLEQGYCTDTITKTIQIKPPFSGIGKVIQTCYGDRGLVKIEDTSRYASSWEWDFGDGTKKPMQPNPIPLSITIQKVAIIKCTSGFSLKVVLYSTRLK